MALINFDQKSFQRKLDKKISLKELLSQNDLMPETSYLDSVKINNQLLDNTDNLENIFITDQDSIELFTKSKIELAFHLLDSASLFLEMLLNQTEKTSQLYQEQKYQEAKDTFMELTDTLSLFIELITNVHRSLRVETNYKLSNGFTIHQLQIHLLSILKAISSSFSKEDTIVLYDLIEHELLDNLKQWKINVIPELKNLKTM